MIPPTLSLNNNVRMPVLGFGTYKLAPGKETVNAVLAALEHGYRLIDTASFYENEASVGEAIRVSGVPRSEIFITTKIWVDQHGYEKSLASCAESLERLGTDYLDLYLIHWPKGPLVAETWKAFEKLHRDGYCRAIGVSNFTAGHLSDLLEYADVIPTVNQVELHPFLTQQPLRSWCREKTVTVQAYRSLLRSGPKDHAAIGGVARRHGKSPAQILIRWALQQGIPVIPKSADPRRIAENADVFNFKLSDDDVAELNRLNQDLHLGPDPALL